MQPAGFPLWFATVSVFRINVIFNLPWPARRHILMKCTYSLLT